MPRVTEFRLADWEHFDAQIDAAGTMARITHVRVVTDDDGTRRIYGDGEPLDADTTEFFSISNAWLRPQDVPTRVIRGDCGWPRLSTEELREIYRNRPIKQEQDDIEDDLRRDIPPPEMRARPATLEEMPRGARDVGKRAHANGFRQSATIARGPRVNQYWRVVEISTSLQLRGQHSDGRRFGAHWLTKTAQRGVKAGVTEWKLQSSWIVVDRVWTRCNATELSEYLVTP